MLGPGVLAAVGAALGAFVGLQIGTVDIGTGIEAAIPLAALGGYLGYRVGVRRLL
jgi:hypothetical protein